MPLRDNSIETWNLAIEDGLEFRRKYGREHDWAKCEALFYQAHEIQANNVGPNLIAGVGDSFLSAMLVQNPFFILKALRMDLIQSVPVLETQLNTLMYALDLKSTMELSTFHAFLYGRGVVKLGYDSEFGYEPGLDLGQHANTVLGMSLTQFDSRGQKIEFNDITPGMPWARAVLPHDFIVPTGVIALKDAPWCGHRIVRHIDDIKADPKYENKKDLVPSLSMADWVKSYLSVMKPYRMGAVQGAQRWNNSAGSGKAEYVEMWEIHDTRTGRVFVVVPGYDKLIRNEIDYLQEDGLPFVDVGFVPAARTFWTTPDAFYLRAPQEEAIDIATVQKHQRRISTLRFLVEEGAMDNDELNKYLSSVIGITVKFKPGHSPPIAVTPPNSNNQLQMDSEAIRRDSRETVGFSRNQQGEFESAGRRTATEAAIVQNKSEVRLDRRQAKLAKAYTDIGRKLAKIIFKFWRTPRLIEIVGQDGAAQWTAFTGSDLKGEYQYRVGFSNEPIETLQSRRQNAMAIFQALSLDPSIDPLALRRYLSRAFNDPEFTSLFKPGIINANLQLPMQQMLPNMGGTLDPNAGGGGNGSATVPIVLRPGQPSVHEQPAAVQGMGQLQGV